MLMSCLITNDVSDCHFITKHPLKTHGLYQTEEELNLWRFLEHGPLPTCLGLGISSMSFYTCMFCIVIVSG